MHQTIELAPPLVSAAHIQERIVCIRAHRERLFEVSTQTRNGKTIFHNYGQGGAGWTFLFGCVHESVSQFEHYVQANPSALKQPICIVGAGCYGLLTAILLARAGYHVRIIAADTQNIASRKAAGFFFPRHRKVSTPAEIAVFRAFGIESYKTYCAIAAGKHSFIHQGPKLLPAYYGLDIDPGFAPYITQHLVQQPERVTISFGTNKRYEVMRYETIFINPAIIMQELERNIHALGINVTKQHIHDFDEINESIIFNCAGLGAKQLTADPKIVPVQGHLITLKNQPPMHELQYMVNVKVVQKSTKNTPRDELIYYAPKDEGILGITFKRGTDSMTDNAYEFERLIERSQQFFNT